MLGTQNKRIDEDTRSNPRAADDGDPPPARRRANRSVRCSDTAASDRPQQQHEDAGAMPAGDISAAAPRARVSISRVIVSPAWLCAVGRGLSSGSASTGCSLPSCARQYAICLSPSPRGEPCTLPDCDSRRIGSRARASRRRRLGSRRDRDWRARSTVHSTTGRRRQCDARTAAVRGRRLRTEAKLRAGAAPSPDRTASPAPAS